jgi:hypothetical protein
MTDIAVRQRPDYTFKFNKEAVRHGWLRLTPAYSVKLVEEILTKTAGDLHVIDPFSGTATTLLCSVYHAYSAVGYEINPFLVWLGGAKVKKYSKNTIKDTKEALETILELLVSKTSPIVDPPAIHNIERWWAPERLRFLCQLKGCIEEICPRSSKKKDLLLISFCRVLIDLSNVAFNHQSMSFKDSCAQKQPTLFSLEPDYPLLFENEAKIILNAALANPEGSANIIQGDSRFLKHIKNKEFDLLITSPPYPNRMSYIRELRPYMYWLNYISEAREAGELDWKAIGGTWGIATSRLNEWQPSSNCFRPKYFEKVLCNIAQSDNKNGELLSRYVCKYFEDMWLHLRCIGSVMKKGGEVHYIIGNSVFYDIVVPVEQIFKDMLLTLEFNNVQIHTLRKRNSKKALYEFDVSART